MYQITKHNITKHFSNFNILITFILSLVNGNNLRHFSCRDNVISLLLHNLDIFIVWKFLSSG